MTSHRRDRVRRAVLKRPRITIVARPVHDAIAEDRLVDLLLELLAESGAR